MDKNLTTIVRGEELVFDCRRVVYWPRLKVLMAADLHWGKTQYLRSHGIGISDGVFEADLRRIGEVLTDYDVDSFIVLGDLVHHELSLTDSIVDRITQFRNDFPCELVLIKGNHDRFAHFPQGWGIVEENDMKIGPFLLAHEPRKRAKDFQFAGHIHPMIRLRAGPDNLKLPAFILDEGFCLVPAFSHLTGGMSVKLGKDQRAIVLTPDGLEVFAR